MSRMLFLLVTTLGGTIGWWVGERLGFGLMGTFFISAIGSFIGIYVAWRITVDYLD